MIALARATWTYRNFVLGSVKREFEARYTHSLLGSAWAILNPITMIVIYTVVFSRIMQARIEGIDNELGYPIYLCAGLFTWTLFSEMTLRAQGMFLEHGNLIKKLNFPRVCLPVIVTLSACLNFAIVFGLFLLFLAVTGNFPGPVSVTAVPVLALQILFALGIGVSLGVLHVFFRDVGQFFTVVVQLWFWLTPIVYPPEILSGTVQRLMRLNPMAPVMRAYQDIFVAGAVPDWASLLPTLAATGVALLVGSYLYRTHSDAIADEL